MKLSHYKDSFLFYFTQIRSYMFWIVLIVLIIILGEVISIGIRYLFKLFIDSAELFVTGSLTESAFRDRVWFYALIATIGVVIYYIFYWVKFHIGNRIITKSSKEAKLTVLKHLFMLDYKFFADTKSGSIITKFTRIERSMQQITESFFLSILPAIVQLLISLIALFTLHYSYALLVLVALIISAAYNIWLQKRQLKIQEEVNEAEESENSLVADSFMNVETIKLFAKEDDIHSRFTKKATVTQQKRLAWEDYFRWFDSFNSAFPLFIMMGLLLASAMLLINDSVTIGDIFFAESTFFALIGYMRYVLWMFRSMYTSLVDLDSISKYMKRKPRIADKKGAKALRAKAGEVTFTNVTFGYGAENSIADVSFTAQAKQSVALVGASGSGKSTLVKLLCRFYDVKRGSIKIDGQDISLVTQKSLRESISFVAQEGILFDDTLYNNICFANPSATPAQIDEAITAAQLRDVVDKLPNKLQTLVGERGIKLSGGERQRVSIARAILANRPIVVLDEATSALDSATEQKIQIALAKLLHNKTAIIIAHRLSTIMHSDNIVVLDGGKVIEQGSHKDLLKQKGRYYTLWKLQKDGFIE